MKKIAILLLIPTLFFSTCKSKKPLPIEGKGLLWAVNWSADGNFIATGGNQEKLLLFSGQDYELLRAIPWDNTITKLRWHPTGGLLAVAAQNAERPPIIWDLENDLTIELDGISPYGARGIGWNYSGEYVAVGDNDGQLFIFERDGRLVRQIDARQKAITGLSWHPSRNILVTVGSQISIYDLEADFLATIPPRPVEVLMLCVEWHPTGNFFVTGDYGDYEQDYPALLQFWSPDGNKLREIERSEAEYRNLRWSPDGEVLATASEAVRLWSRDGELLEEQKTEGLLWGVDWSPDGEVLITSDETGQLELWARNLRKLQGIRY